MRLHLMCIVLCGALSAGCVALKPAAPVQATVLLSVTFNGEYAHESEPIGLIVNVDEQPGAVGWQFAFAPSTAIAGHDARFLVKLDLPPGRHRLTRLSGITPGGLAAPELDVDPDMAFQASPNATDYLGHIELSPAVAGNRAAPEATRVVIANAYDEELPGFVKTWPTLRSRAIGRRAPQATTAVVSRPHLQESTAGNGKEVPAVRLDAAAASALPLKARAAFEIFLQSRYPRAFAIASSGQTGAATGGRNVIARSLEHCNRAASFAGRRSSCRLFALDDTLISSLQVSGTALDSRMPGR
jgi:hypothetical protein